VTPAGYADSAESLLQRLERLLARWTELEEVCRDGNGLPGAATWRRAIAELDGVIEMYRPLDDLPF
jgi:hypothetical protein